MLKWNTMIDKQPKEGDRFVALYNDGGGADIFLVVAGGVIDAGKEFDTSDCLDDYLYWALLPDGFKFWHEN